MQINKQEKREILQQIRVSSMNPVPAQQPPQQHACFGTTTATMSATPTNNSKILKNELRYVPLPMSNNNITTTVAAAPAIMSIPMHNAATISLTQNATLSALPGTGSLLHLLQVTNGAGGAGNAALVGNAAAHLSGVQHQLLPQVAIITSTGGAGGAASAAATTTTLPPALAAAVMQANSAVSGSILIRNQPTYAITTTSGQRGTVTSTTSLPPILNQELVKQIVVGNVTRPTAAAHLAPATTLLKSNQQMVNKMHTTFPTQQSHQLQSMPKQPTQHILLTTTTTTSPTAMPRQQSTQQIKKHNKSLSKSTSSMKPTNTTTTTTSSLTATANAPQAIMAAINRQNNVSSFQKPDPVILNKKYSAPQAKIAQTKRTDEKLPQLIAKEDYPQPLNLEKRESLLKAKSTQRVISPRAARRSKSLNTTAKQTASEAALRRHSSPATIAARSQMTAVKALLKTMESTDNSECEIVDLIDYEEDYLESSGEKLENNNEGEEKLTESKGLKELVESKAEEKPEIKAEQKTEQANSQADTPQLELKEDIEETKEMLMLVKVEPTEVAAKIVPETTPDEPNREQLKVKSVDQLMPVGSEATTLADMQTNHTALEDKDADTSEDEEDGGRLLIDTDAEKDMLVDKSLLCDEKIMISSSSSSSSSTSLSYSIHSTHDAGAVVSPLLKLKLPASHTSSSAGTSATTPIISSNSLYTEASYGNVLKMLSNFNMLNWRERVGTTPNTSIRFELNDYNLLQIHERCGPRMRIHTAYEKPIYERESNVKGTEAQDPFLYLCRRCNCHGPATDFLAPEYCSLECLKRVSRKRQRDMTTSTVVTKRTRYSGSTSTMTKSSASALTQQQCSMAAAAAASKRIFRWATYLPEKSEAIAAPVGLFLNPFPSGPNQFEIGMKLEAIDPENCSLFCVCTVVDIQGYRLKLTFDGYEYMYDFWVNADSMDIFPPGWCAKTNRILQPPKGINASDFNWPIYLAETKATHAPRQLFTHLNSSSMPTQNPFKIGMHLEAEDLNDTGKLCVATVADVLDNRLRIHFDGWDACYDYWVDVNSPYIHECGWHKGRQQLIVPPDFDNTNFSWRDYIRHVGKGVAAIEELFEARDTINFTENMKLEVVDPRNPSLIRPATVISRKGHRVKLHLDCWSSDYCFWLEDDSPDLHPIGWCDATGHDLEPPPGYKMRPNKIACSINGCRGIGNVKRLYQSTHSTRDCCPYEPENWRQKVEKPPRLDRDHVVRQRVVKPPQVPVSIARQPTQQQAPSKSNKRYMHGKQILEHMQMLDSIKTRQALQEKPAKQQADYQEHLLHIKQNLEKKEAAPVTNAVVTATTSKPVLNGRAEAVAQTPLPVYLQISKEFLYDYGPRLQQNYDIWQKNALLDVKHIKRNPLLWSSGETSDFVEAVLGDAQAAGLFACEDIDGKALLLLQQNDLTEMLGLKLGPAVKLYSCIMQLRTLAVGKFNVKTLQKH